MKTNDQQYASGVKSGLETKYTDLELREMSARKYLNKNFKANLRITNKRLNHTNNYVGYQGLRNIFSLVEVENLILLSEV